MPIRNSVDGAVFDARGYSHGNRPDTWLKPGLSERLAELHRLNQSSFLEIAEILSTEFGIPVSRNAVIGRAKRMRLPKRAPAPRIAAKQPPVTACVVNVRIDPPPPRPSRIPGKSRNLTIYQLRDGCCRWPYGHKAPFRFCGRATLTGSSWCPQHAALATVRSRGGWS
jgi:hypothetical protein